MWPRPWLRTVSHQLRSKHCFAVTSSSSSPPPSPASSSPPPLPSWPSPPSRHCLQLQNHLYRHIQQLTFSMIWNFNFIKPALASPWIALFIPYKYRYTRTVIDSTQRYVVREYTCNKWGHSVETIALLLVILFSSATLIEPQKFSSTFIRTSFHDTMLSSHQVHLQ